MDWTSKCCEKPHHKKQSQKSGQAAFTLASIKLKPVKPNLEQNSDDQSVQVYVWLIRTIDLDEHIDD